MSHVLARAGEDIIVTKDGLAIPESNLAWNRDPDAVTCRPLNIKLTMYGDEILFDCENKTEKDLFNFISRDRLCHYMEAVNNEFELNHSFDGRHVYNDDGRTGRCEPD